jgi:hypothetical protein
VPVAEPEVYRYYATLHEARVDRANEMDETWQPDHELLVQTDSMQTLRLACNARAQTCRRDEGPLLRVTDTAVRDMGFSVGTFAQRRLVDLAPGEARAIEILPGEQGARQSIRLDLGVWRADAPEGGETDPDRVNAVLAAVISARARNWVDAPEGAPLRTLRIERAPRQGRSAVEIVLHAGCIAQIDGRERAAVLFPETCEAMSLDLVSSAQ